jgi:hypothetical protein
MLKRKLFPSGQYPIFLLSLTGKIGEVDIKIWLGLVFTFLSRNAVALSPAPSCRRRSAAGAVVQDRHSLAHLLVS